MLFPPHSAPARAVAAGRFPTLALMEALPDLVQLCLAHDPGQTEQQAVMVSAGIVEAFAVGDDNAEERAQIEELMPVAVVAGKPGSVETDGEAGIAQSDFGDRLLEAHPFDRSGSGFAKIFIDDVHAFMRPAEGHGTIDEAVLQFRAFLTMPHLVHGGLADVNVSELAAMRRSDALVRAIRCSQHADPPPTPRLSVASAGEVARCSALSASASPPAR